MTALPLIRRRELVAALLARRDGALVVPGLGSPTWDCFAAGDSAEFLYSWGGMGLAVSTALGLALARPDKRIFALTGDGEMMMGLGSLAVVGAQAPANLGILVLDNEHFDIVTTDKADMGPDHKYAYLFGDRLENGHRVIGHNGGAPGINAELNIYLDLGYTVAVMSNYDHAASTIADRIHRLIIGP